MTKLAKIEEVTAVQVYGEGKMDPLLTEIEKEVRSFVPVLDTVVGRKDIASIAHKVARSKTFLDDLGKNLIEESKKKVDAVNVERKGMRDRLDTLKATVRKPLTDWEDKEKDRIDGIYLSLDYIKSFSETLGEDGIPFSSLQLKVRLEELHDIKVDGSFGEFEEQAAKSKADQVERVAFVITCREKAEADEAELDRLRIEKENRELADKLEAEKKADEERRIKEAAEEEARIAAAQLEAAEKAKRDAEEVAEVERMQVEANRIAVEESHRLELEKREAEKQAEIDELKKLQEEKEAEDIRIRENTERLVRVRKEEEARKEKKRQENVKHRASVDNNILSALSSVKIDIKMGRALIEEINAGHIPNVSIQY